MGIIDTSAGSLAIITARGGSKRIPRKNIRDFCGRPIISYSIEAAIESGLFEEVMVSTDDEEIAQIALSEGASVPFMRSAEASGDHATTSDVLGEVLSCYHARGKYFSEFCCIYPTAPFVTSAILVDAQRILHGDDEVDSVVPIVEFSFPPQRAFLEEDGKVWFARPELSQMRSQDLRPVYHDCGQFYFCRTERFEKFKNIIMPGTVGMKRSELVCQDIDNPADWKIAEMKYKLAKAEGLL